jgi:hypothetical protein
VTGRIVRTPPGNHVAESVPEDHVRIAVDGRLHVAVFARHELRVVRDTHDPIEVEAGETANFTHSGGEPVAYLIHLSYDRADLGRRDRSTGSCRPADFHNLVLVANGLAEGAN